MPYSRLSTKVSDYLSRELGHDEEKREIIAYAVDSIILIVTGFLMIVAVGFILGVPGATFFAVLSGGLLRQLSGGFHFTAPLPCLVFGAFIYPLLGWISMLTFSLLEDRLLFFLLLIGLCATSLILVGVLAPVDSPAKPIISITFRRKLKYYAISWVLLCSIIALLYKETYIGLSLVSGLTFQSLTLLPFLNKIKK